MKPSLVCVYELYIYIFSRSFTDSFQSMFLLGFLYFKFIFNIYLMYICIVS